MRNHANKGCKLAIVVFIPTSLFSKERFLKRYLHENEAWHTPTFYMKMNRFSIVFHMT